MIKTSFYTFLLEASYIFSTSKESFWKAPALSFLYNTSARDKLLLDLLYIEQQSFLLDMRIVFLTVKIMFTPDSTEGFEESQSKGIKEKAHKSSEFSHT